MSTTTISKFRLGSPQITGPLALFPLFGPEPRLRYASLARAVKLGASIGEVHDQGSVNEVLATNATDQPLLLYEGELILGARQNRVVDATVLVPAGVKLKVPVSCVEQGRWEHGKRTDSFAPAPFAADPELRRVKRTTANARSAAGAPPLPEQGEVWHHVGTRLATHAVASPSSALSDVYRAKRPVLDAFTRSIHALDGQLGAVVEISGRPVALDLVSRPEVFADLLPRLAEGYALQALDMPADPPSVRAAQLILEEAFESERSWLPTPGIGEAFALNRPWIEGSGLRSDGELVALSAFPAGKA